MVVLSARILQGLRFNAPPNLYSPTLTAGSHSPLTLRKPVPAVNLKRLRGFLTGVQRIGVVHRGVSTIEVIDTLEQEYRYPETPVDPDLETFLTQ